MRTHPASADPDSYRTDAGGWSSLQPDFVVVSRRDKGSLGVSIIDPHGDHLADSLNKLKALASYAERFGDQFVRIESIAKSANGVLRSLDLKVEAVRTLVAGFTGAEVATLYASGVSLPYE